MDDSTEKDDEVIMQNEMSVVDSRELDEADLNAMKGDRIGDTVYSAKWILNTLISLSKVYDDGWSESLEDNLCMLWDMTAEKDIVQFLADNDFIKIAEFTLKVSKEPRLTEIILGIVGNMCCQPTVLETVANENNFVFTIFGLLSTEDPETLVQILRLLQAAVWDVHRNEQTKWLRHLKDCEFFGDAISFILTSSTNEHLLIAATDLLQLITVVPMPEDDCLLFHLFKVNRLMPGLLESFSQLVPVERDVAHSYTKLKFIENWLTILSCIAQSDFKTFSNDDNDDCFAKIIDIFSIILRPYTYSSNLMPLDKKAAACIHESVEMISWLRRDKMHPDAGIIHIIVMILHKLRLVVKSDSEQDSFEEPDETMIKLVKHLERYWLDTLTACEENNLLKIFEMCNDATMNCLMEVATEYSKEFEHAVKKLLRVQSLR